MGLPEVILEIVRDMEHELENYDSSLHNPMRQYLKQLKIAAKSAQSSQPENWNQIKERPSISRRDQEELNAAVARAESGSSMVEIVGGPLNETFVPIDSRMPVEAFTQIMDKVYQLRADRKLYLVEGK